MKRALLMLTTLLVLAAEVGSSQPRSQDAPEQAPPGPTPAAAPPAALPTHDPLDEFVPHEKLEADSVVAMPVDI